MASEAVEQNCFLNIQDKAIKGNSTVTTEGLDETIILQNVNFGVSQAGEWEEGASVTGRVTGRGDVSVTKVMDTAHPDLVNACVRKTQYDTAVISWLAGNSIYYSVALEKVIITAVGVDWANGDAKPLESITMSYRKATWRFDTAEHSYNFATNE